MKIRSGGKESPGKSDGGGIQGVMRPHVEGAPIILMKSLKVILLAAVAGSLLSLPALAGEKKADCKDKCAACSGCCADQKSDKCADKTAEKTGDKKADKK